MAKPKQTASKTEDYKVRNFPADLLKKLREVRRETGVPIYRQITDAVREKLEREKES